MIVKVTDIEPKADQRNLFVDSESGDTAVAALSAGVSVILSIDIQNVVINYDEMYNVAHKIRVDTNDSDHDFPNGASLTSDQREIRIIGPYGNDQTFSSTSDGLRNYCFMLKNDDSSSHTYYITLKFYHFRQVPTIT